MMHLTAVLKLARRELDARRTEGAEEDGEGEASRAPARRKPKSRPRRPLLHLHLT